MVSIFVSERPMIGRALDDFMRSDGSSGIELVGRFDLPRRCQSKPATIELVLVDLDDEHLPVDEFADLMAAATNARWSGFHDELTPQRAKIAFELGLTQLISSAEPLDRIRRALTMGSTNSRAHDTSGLPAIDRRMLDSLTGDEHLLLRGLASGSDLAALAREFGMTRGEADRRCERIQAALGVRRTADAVALAIRCGILDDA